MQWGNSKEHNKLLTMHRRLSPTPFSSDEGAESGDDSDEDLITNYMSTSPTTTTRNVAAHPQLMHHQQQQQQQQHQHHPQQLPLNHRHQPVLQRQAQHAVHPVQYHADIHSVHPAHHHGHGGPPRRLVRMAEIPTMDSVTVESYGGPPTHVVPPSAIPTISITPHSPITQKPFTLLEDSVRHLQDMQENIQKMREVNAVTKSGRALTRLSSSCPSLNVEGEEVEEEDPSSCKSGGSLSGAIHRGSLGAEDHSPSPTTPLTSGSLDDTHLCPDTPKIRVNDSTPTGSDEFLLDDRKIRAPTPLDHHRRRSWSGLSDEEKKRARQRSVSLSSLDSDTEEPFFDAEDNSHPPVGGGSESLDGTRRSPDKQRSLSGSSSPVAYKGRKGGSSTHSLNEVHLDDKKVKRNTSEKPRLLTPRLTLQKSISTPSILAGVINQQLQKQGAQSSDQYDYESVVSKPRKRGSIFFRKKKDKSKKSSHQFVGVCYSNSATCDVCSKPMTNKPALRCETCLVCVHENTCKDQISDCSKLKNPKVAQKSSSSASLSNATKNSSLGSSSGSSFASSFNTATRSRSSVSHSSSPTRPYSIAAPSKVTSEERELLESHGDSSDVNILDVNSASMESLDDAPETAPDSNFDYIDSDPELRLFETEPELWVKTVDKELLSTLNENQIKKQEYIYELIMTEKKHCKTLKVIKKLFAEGMLKELGLKEAFVKSIFPCLDELITIHFNFLWRLRERQRVDKYIQTIGDLLLDQFSADNAQSLKDAYGIICAKQPDSIASFKELQKSDRRFQNFIKNRSIHPLLEKKEVTGRWVFTSQRCTKYPLGLKEMIKHTKDNPDEKETLKAALDSIKDILRDINTQIHEKEMRQRLLEIYHKIDAKSSTTFKEHKFKKSDLLTDGRKLMFEGTATLLQQRGKQITVVVVVMSDVLFFLHENNQKYYFVSSDNKAEAIPLSKLIVREKASHDKAIYILLSGNHVEMYELECIHPIGRKTWLETIREIVDHCPDDELGLKRLSEGSADRAHELIMEMQHLDKELAKICEQKNKAVYELVSTMGGETSSLQTPEYRSLLDEHTLDHESAKALQISSLNEALRLIDSSCGWASNLARSVSSVGEHQSDAYVSPILPKRAETFGGFDNPIKDNPKQSVGKKKKDSKVSLLSINGSGEVAEGIKHRRPSGTSLTVQISPENLSHSTQSVDSNTNQQQTLAPQLIHFLTTSLVLGQHHLTQYEKLRAKVSTGSAMEGRFSHSQKLEELRNIQEQISRERSQWTQERDNQEKWISDKKEELNKLQKSLRAQQDDVAQQRDDLYRKLETLRSQGIMLNQTMNVISTHPVHPTTPDPPTTSLISDMVTTSSTSPQTSPTSGVVPSHKIKVEGSKLRYSTTSLTKRDSNPTLVKPVKQQLPMKLAKLSSGGSSSSSSSSMSSSLSAGSFGGSPSQDRVDLLVRGAPSPPTGGQQILPLKLSEATPRVTGGYQRLASPPDHSSSSHAGRAGTSPANLQNGGASTTGSRHPYTYPKVPPRPPRPPSSDVSRTGPGQRIRDPDTNQDIIFF